MNLDNDDLKPATDDDFPADLLDENIGEKEEKPVAKIEKEPEAKPAVEQSIPYARFKEINDKFKDEREARAAQEAEFIRLRTIVEMLQKQAPAPTEAKPAAQSLGIRDLAKKQGEAMLDGDFEKAAEFAEQIADHHRRVAEEAIARAIAESRTKDRQSTVAERLQEEAQRIGAEFPALDNNSPEYDAELVGMVLSHRDSLVVSKKVEDPVKALRQSVETFKKRGLLGVVAAADPVAVPAPAFENAKAASRQPPRPSTSGTTGSKGIDVMSTSVDAWANLPDEERHRLLFN